MYILYVSYFIKDQQVPRSSLSQVLAVSSSVVKFI